ncbi:MAG TPA: 3-oxoacyl-ACP reductase family protein [Nitrospinota bacterium]|nr:3-oxoacyl-ACP reductase family protein [Nitrospinota bacterium]
MRLEGKVVIVTGAGRNLGRVYAKGLAREGAKVAAADIIDASGTVEEIEAAGGEAMAVSVDVTDEEATWGMAKSVHDRFGRIDGLVNNAALYQDLSLGPFFEITGEEWDRAMAVNLKGVFFCCKAVFPYMKDQEFGRILNIASNTVYKGTVGLIHYVTSKAGILGFTRSLARECGGYGINVNTVAPDYIPHERDNRERPELDEMNQKMRIIQRREVPEDMVGTIVFLLSSDADFITGQTLVVNGGAVMP